MKKTLCSLPKEANSERIPALRIPLYGNPVMYDHIDDSVPTVNFLLIHYTHLLATSKQLVTDLYQLDSNLIVTCY